MTKFLELCVQGVATGAQYALVALGFVIIYRATGVINFAQAGFVVLGAYLAYNFHITFAIPFYPSMVLAMAAGASRFTSRTLGGAFDACATRTAIALSLSNGKRPVTARNATTPSE